MSIHMLGGCFGREWGLFFALTGGGDYYFQEIESFVSCIHFCIGFDWAYLVLQSYVNSILFIQKKNVIVGF